MRLEHTRRQNERDFGILADLDELAVGITRCSIVIPRRDCLMAR